jgi:cbb3-type cytochrome oxidase maturation protein
MNSAYLIIAVVVAIVLSFVGIIHFFWLRDDFNVEKPQFSSGKGVLEHFDRA